MTNHSSKTLLVLLPSWNPGGADLTYLGPIVPFAIKAGWKVHTACSARAELEPLARRLESLGATHHHCEIAEEHCTGLRYQLMQRRFRRNTLAVLNTLDPDAVLLVLPWSTHGLGVMRACQARAIPTATVFQLVRPSHPPRWRRRATRALLDGCCHPIAVSENNREILASLFDIEREKIALIHNGIDVEPDPPPESIAKIRLETRRALGVDDHAVLCLTTARLAPQKGHLHLVEALPAVVSRHPQAHFIFAGEGQERIAIEARIQQLRLDTHVHLLGERKDIDILTRAADLFVFPTLFEGSPFALVEAMGRGLPIVTTDASGIPEVVRHEQEGYVVPKENPEALANAICEAIAQPERMRAYAHHARERATLFSGRVMADRTIEMLNSIRKRKQHRSASHLNRQVPVTLETDTESTTVGIKNSNLKGPMKISLVICTYDRPRILEHALDSLVHQRADDATFEVLVIDNKPNPETRALVEEKARTRAIFSYLEEPRGGLSFARDTGYRAATCDWVVYLDDDIRAHPDLVERITRIIEEHPFDCFGGLCLPWYQDPPPAWLHDRYVINEIDGVQAAGVLKTGYAKGALIAFRKSILEELGGFTRSGGRQLGMSEGRIAYGEETRIQHEMRRKGYVIGFDPDLRVDHLVHPERTHPGFFLKMRFAKGRDHWDTFGIRPTKGQLAACAAAAVIKPLIMLPGCLFRYATQRNYRPMNILLDTLYPSALHMGQVKGGLRVRAME